MTAGMHRASLPSQAGLRKASMAQVSRQPLWSGPRLLSVAPSAAEMRGGVEGLRGAPRGQGHERTPHRYVWQSPTDHCGTTQAYACKRHCAQFGTAGPADGRGPACKQTLKHARRRTHIHGAAGHLPPTSRETIDMTLWGQELRRPTHPHRACLSVCQGSRCQRVCMCVWPWALARCAGQSTFPPR